MDGYSCSSPGNADMYGFGIRLGFYIQWLAGALAALLPVESDVVATRSGLLGFTIAMFVAVVVQTAKSANTTVDRYVALLLCFGYFYLFLAIYFWRICTGFDSKRDPTRWTVVVASPEFDIIQKSLLLAVSGFKLWFWAINVLEPNNRPECSEYGFLFYRLDLKGNPVRVVNICVDCCMTLIFAYELASAIIRAAERRPDQRVGFFNRHREWIAGTDEEARRLLYYGGPAEAQKKQKLKQAWELFLLRTITSSVVVVAIELTIQWNQLESLYELGSAGQMIPFMLGSLMLVHTIYRKIRPTQDVQDGVFGPALYVASARGQRNIVRKLLDKDVDVDLRGKHTCTALEVAAVQGHRDIVQMLLERNADPNLGALQAASAKGHREIVQMLLDRVKDPDVDREHGVDFERGINFGHGIDLEHRKYGTALQAASAEGHCEIVEMLLDKGADVNLQTTRRGTPLYMASLRGHREIVQKLLDEDVDVDVQNHDSQSGHYGTALKAASEGNHREIVQMLLDKDADVNLGALQAASGQGHLEIVEMLLNKGADINLKFGNSGTALYEASVAGQSEMVQMLLDKKNIDINFRTSENTCTALEIAAIQGHPKVVQMLLDKGAEHGAALVFASERNRREIVEMLLDKGADVNHESKYSGTALWGASKMGYREIVQILLDKGADVHYVKPESSYRTALSVLQAALAGGHHEIVEMLREKGAV